MIDSTLLSTFVNLAELVEIRERLARSGGK
jgi:hypothetical protein